MSNEPAEREAWRDRVSAVVDQVHEENIGGQHRTGFCEACAVALQIVYTAIPAPDDPALAARGSQGETELRRALKRISETFTLDEGPADGNHLRAIARAALEGSGEIDPPEPTDEESEAVAEAARELDAAIEDELVWISGGAEPAQKIRTNRHGRHRILKARADLQAALASRQRTGGGE